MNWDELYWDQIPFVAFDTETTGFGKEDRICQVAMASFFSDGKIHYKSWLIYPGREIPEESTRVHGITNEMVRKAPMFAEVMDEIVEELERAPWVAHNLQFDARMLAREIPLERWPRGLPTLCTLSFAKKHEETKNRKGHKLADLANVFAVDYEARELHDAKYDAGLLAHVARSMLRGREVGRFYTKMSEDWLK